MTLVAKCRIEIEAPTRLLTIRRDVRVRIYLSDTSSATYMAEVDGYTLYGRQVSAERFAEAICDFLQDDTLIRHVPAYATVEVRDFLDVTDGDPC